MSSRFDADGDIKMVAPPVYEFIKAPRLAAWSQQALVVFQRERRQYEDKMRERCAATGEVPERVVASVKGTIETRVLDHVARYVLKRDVFDITDVDLWTAIAQKTGSLVNNHVPDVGQLVKDRLKMDLREVDIEARVFKYYLDFDKIVQDHGLTSIIGSAPVIDEDGRQRMKTRCKLLIENLQPEVLRLDVERLVSLTHRNAKSDDIALYDLVVERGRHQQHFHLMAGEVKREPASGKKARLSNDKASKAKGGDQPAAAAISTAVPRKDPPKDGCLHCGGTHWLRNCPTASQEQKDEARRRWKVKKEGKTEKVKMMRAASGVAGTRTATIDDVLEVPLCVDTGADCNVLSSAVVNELADLDTDVLRVSLEPPVIVELAGGKRTECCESVTVDVRIITAAGPLHLTNVRCLVLENHDDELLLGRETLREIGIDVDNMIDQLAGPDRVAVADDDDLEDDYVVVTGEPTTDIDKLLDRMLKNAEDEGFDAHHMPALRSLVNEFRDVWRTQLGEDEPADVEPLRVQLREGVEPYRSGTRKYPEVQRDFLRRYVRELEANGLIYRNNGSRWACAVHPVKKQGSNDYRITVDYRPVNRCTVPLAGATPNLRAVTQAVRGAYGFGQFDFFKGFWQLPLALECRELFSFVTEDGVFTPTRVPQGAADSALHFQLQMHAVFREQLYDSVLVWIDDVLLFATSPADFVDRLRVFFQILRARNLKLNATKCKLFAPQVIWCGKLIDGEGVQHDPARLEALRKMPLPPTAAALQNFLCAVNWLRESMVDYARVVGPLQAKLEDVMKARGRKKKQLTGVDLPWSKDDEAAFRMVLSLLTTSTKTYFADPTADVCLFTDASNNGWAVVLTQVKDWEPAKPVVDQHHELLACLSGLFRGAEVNWSVIEKEAYPVVRACADLAYLLEREKGFRIYCDHANLVEVFAPHKEIKAHVRGKLQRWALKIVGARYTIEHIRGDDNVWADIVSRWAQPQPVAQVKRTTARTTPRVSELRPLQDPGFRWPDAEDIRRAQARSRRDAPADAVEVDGLLRVGGRVWLPEDARDLIKRVMVVAHCGLQGHRGEHVMVEVVKEHFELVRLRATVARFVRSCLLCKHVKGGLLIQREWDPATAATERNQCMHYDYLYLGESYGDAQYVLVLKDELTHYCELVAADSPTSLTAAEALLDWHKRFGPPHELVSDQGSHFTAMLLEELTARVNTRQRFVPVYTPWINGTVERLNRDFLQVLRVLLLELQLDTRNWVHLLPVIQANLNHTRVPSLGGYAPVELFTGLPAPTPLDSIVVPGQRRAEVLPVDLSVVATQLEALREHLREIHAVVADIKERKRVYEMGRAKGQVCNFSKGDYVLWSRIDKRLQGGKLLVRWVGPFSVDEVHPHSFQIKHLLTGDLYDVHGSRLKFYHDEDLDVTAEIRQHVAHQGIVLEIREIVNHRRNRATGQMELLVAWRGLQDEENSWEPFEEIQRGAPELVRRYVEAHAEPALVALVPSLSDQ